MVSVIKPVSPNRRHHEGHAGKSAKVLVPLEVDNRFVWSVAWVVHESESQGRFKGFCTVNAHVKNTN
jgi:hypothetical protein